MAASPHALAPDGPLAGLRVLDISTVVAGPFASTMLADLGAEVLKVEMPGEGDALRRLAPHKDGVPLWWKVTTTLDANLATVAGVQHHYAITFTDGAGAFTTNGGRWQWYRDGDAVAFLDVSNHLAAMQDVNNWLGRSQWSADSLANNDYAEVRISNVALSRGQILANYLLGPNYVPTATATLTNNDALGTTSFNAAGQWSDGSAPAGGNTYETFDFQLRTPATSSAYTFAGDALTVSGGALLWKGTASSTITVNNLTLTASTYASWFPGITVT